MRQKTAMSIDEMSLFFKALRFAAEKHRDQRRKDRNASPYINHPIQVAEVLWQIGQVRDMAVLAAALLHDTLEDTNATPEELQALCGAEVLALVQEVTDDKTLSKVERKRRQIEQAKNASPRAKALKLADKICNVYDIAHAPPLHWSHKRRSEYLQWSEHVVAGLRGSHPVLEAHYDDVLAQARHRLSYEQEHQRVFRIGDRVRHPKKPQWGLGQILDITEQKRLRVFFVGAGQKILRQENTALIRLDASHGGHPLLDNLRVSPDRKVIGYQPMPVLIETFLSRYMEGFYSDAYLQIVRQPHLAAHQCMQENLSQTLFLQLLSAHEYRAICQRALKVLSIAPLLSDVEQLALQEGLNIPLHQQVFAEKLFSLLFSNEAIEHRFNTFVAGLMQMNAAHWRIVTSFLFIAYPETDLLLDPDVTLPAAHLCAFELDYGLQPNWHTYQRVLDFANYLDSSLVDMRPRDMFDVYAFMTVNVA
jgi:guanosine-3',5'-bis(diphosphate) 3'-pyrophosphohydrolase